MVKRENTQLYLLFIVLVLSSLISTFSVWKEIKKEKDLFQRMEENRNNALSLFNDYIEIDEYRVESLLNNFGFHIEDESPQIVLFVPPSPCPPCLEREMRTMIEFLQSYAIKCTILGTSQKRKDLHALSSEYENIFYSLYPIEAFLDEELMDRIIYLLFVDRQIQKVFVTSKSEVFPSSRFFERVVTILSGKDC